MRIKLAIFVIAVLTMMSACSAVALAPSNDGADATEIVLSDNGITVNGSAISSDPTSAVYAGADIIYYRSGTDPSYGEGTSEDMHTASEAKKHTVVTITQPGTYSISGTLSYGQIAIDVGNSSSDVVTLILDGVDITCTVAPAIIFYNVWESGDSSKITTSIPDEAGANVIIADDTINDIKGSYVAKIYKEGTTSTLHKFDGAFYSKMSMIINGETKGNGILNINAENEGLCSELHLTINGGRINITAQDDGINANKDWVSVIEINGGTLYINGGLGSEGDGIDSNGHLIINGGTVVAMANPKTGDGGIDADGDIIINGGTVVAFGTRNDSVSSSSDQAFMELMFSSPMAANTILGILDEDGNVLLLCSSLKAYQSFTFSSPDLELDMVYQVYTGGTSTGTLTNCIYGEGNYYGGTQMKYSGGTDFVLTSSQKTFNSVSATSSTKTTVTIEVEGLSSKILAGEASISSIIIKANGSAIDIAGDIMITIQDHPSASYYASALLGDGLDAVNALLPTDYGTYIITVAVLNTNSSYAGSYEYVFELVDEDGLSNNENNGDGNALLYVVAIIAILLCVLVVYVILKNKKVV